VRLDLIRRHCRHRNSKGKEDRHNQQTADIKKVLFVIGELSAIGHNRVFYSEVADYALTLIKNMVTNNAEVHKTHLRSLLHGLVILLS
jgi:hypothetical protein